MNRKVSYDIKSLPRRVSFAACCFDLYDEARDSLHKSRSIEIHASISGMNSGMNVKNNNLVEMLSHHFHGGKVYFARSVTKRKKEKQIDFIFPEKLGYIAG